MDLDDHRFGGGIPPPQLARDIATGLFAGTPVRNELAASGVTDLQPVIDAVAARIAERRGGEPVSAKLSADVVAARR